jgi:hypothetical protein
MQSAGSFRNRVPETVFCVPQHVSDGTETFHAGDDMFRDDTDPGNHLIENFIFCRQFFSAGLLFRLMTDGVSGFVPLKSAVFENPVSAGSATLLPPGKAGLSSSAIFLSCFFPSYVPLRHMTFLLHASAMTMFFTVRVFFLPL